MQSSPDLAYIPLSHCHCSGDGWGGPSLTPAQTCHSSAPALSLFPFSPSSTTLMVLKYGLSHLSYRILSLESSVTPSCLEGKAPLPQLHLQSPTNLSPIPTFFLFFKIEINVHKALVSDIKRIDFYLYILQNNHHNKYS